MKYWITGAGIHRALPDHVPVSEGSVEITEQEYLDWQAANPVVPKSVSMRQARLALLQSGLLANVDAAINSLSSPQKEYAQIEWEYSQEVQRDKELVALLAPALGLDDAELDALFVLAATL
jgi:hypothetical protein